MSDLQEFTLHANGRSLKVGVANKSDGVQTYHQWGLFYEADQLDAHRKLIPHGSTVLDVGTNVGNHALYYAGIATAGRVYVFEPNKPAREILLHSVSLNEFREKIDLSYVDLAVGSSSIEVEIGGEYENNLGATFLREASAGSSSIACRPLDSLDFEGHVSFIKIDVEGMEIEVLNGAVELLNRFRPSVAIEVNSQNTKQFSAWLDRSQYQVINMFHETAGLRNYVCIPRP